MSTTYVFPDSSLPETTNGGFRNQEEFRSFVMRNQKEGRWSSTLHARPFAERLEDYKGQTIAEAFPLQFPYGHSGLKEDPGVMAMKESSLLSSKGSRNRLDVLRKYLSHRNPYFHGPKFNLIVENLIMKEQIFQSTRMHCTVQSSDGASMAEKYGAMTSEELQKAIDMARRDHGSQHSSRPESRYLKSISASCESLPHTNEAARQNRRVYLSYLMKHRLPAIFLTVTPDDKRNFRIVIYSGKCVETPNGSVDVSSLTDDDILTQFTIREKIREDFPGLCALEYQRIIKLVIKHLLAWDETKKESTGMGLFGEVLAWTLATEEQGRKTLHGHFLVWIKNWDKVLNKLETPGAAEEKTFREATKSAKSFISNACSAELFSEFGKDGLLNQQPVFAHDDCRPVRASKHRRYTVEPVGDQALREMRHKRKCNEHNGLIARCPGCNQSFTVQGIIEKALRYHFGGSNQKPFNFLSRNDHRLDRLVYEMQKDFNWSANEPEKIAKRYFACNALVNMHLPTHTARCFKKGCECYTNLPDMPMEQVAIQYATDIYIATNWCGKPTNKAIFSIYPKRSLEDAFMNTHNPVITTLLGCNNNVIVGMNGASAFYVTSYGAKGQQEDERKAFEKVSSVIIKVLQRQEQEGQEEGADLPPSHMGFRRMLAGICTHTCSHIVAAPMAHYLAINGSRFQFSEEHDFLPAWGLENILLDRPMVMGFRNVKGKQVPQHAAMDYLHRPKDLEELPPYEFYSHYERATKPKGKTDETNYLSFRDDHPLCSVMVCVKRKKPVVPVFPWNWLPNAKKLGSSFLEDFPPQTADNFAVREQHALRFMILFTAYRSKADLVASGTHQDRLRQKLLNAEIDPEMILIADNIQAIYDSLEAGRPENMLTAGTWGPEADDIEGSNKEDNKEDSSFEDMLAQIGAYMASTSEGQVLTEEAIDLTPECIPCKKEPESEPGEPGTEPPQELQGVFSISQEGHNAEAPTANEHATRFRSTTSELNSYFSSSFCTENPEYNPDNQENPGKKYVVEATGTWESIVAWAKNEGLDAEQETAFEILAAAYVLSFVDEAEDDLDNQNDKEQFRNRRDALRKLARQKEPSSPIRLFVTGPAGAGKSKVLLELERYAKNYSAGISHTFTSDSIKITALTGAAATEIGGETTAREFGLLDHPFQPRKYMNGFSDTRLCVVDEISFMSYKELAKLSSHMQHITECTERLFGKPAIVFLGDFCQLECIGGDPIYMETNSMYWEQVLTSMVELKGTHRYKCSEMKKIMPRTRNEGLSDAHRAILNSRVIDGVNVKTPQGLDTRYATYHNKNRVEINATVFKKYLDTYHKNATECNVPKTAIVIRCNASWHNSGKPLTFGQRRTLFTSCSETDTKGWQNERCAPLLCLFSGSLLMGTENEGVDNGIANGIANGTTAAFQKVVFKEGYRPKPMKMHGKWVCGTDIDHVDHLVARWHDSQFQGTFEIFPKQRKFRVNYPIEELGFGKTRVKTSMQLTFFPVVINHATTGHKLQGKSMSQLVVAEWSKVKNWAYVVLSGVPTLASLFLTSSIPADIKLTPHPEYLGMMERLRHRILATPQEVETLKANFHSESQEE